ncbi:MAG: hypothetical protein MZV70_60555 [Desulfobacterales bacterium]|nr:hypothetical protein [Desulfobacterales bacterium]
MRTAGRARVARLPDAAHSDRRNAERASLELVESSLRRSSSGSLCHCAQTDASIIETLAAGRLLQCRLPAPTHFDKFKFRGYVDRTHLTPFALLLHENSSRLSAFSRRPTERGGHPDAADGSLPRGGRPEGARLRGRGPELA